MQVQNSEDLRDVFANRCRGPCGCRGESYWLPWCTGARIKLSYYSKKVGEPTICRRLDLVITQDSDTYPAWRAEKETRRLNYWFSYTRTRTELLVLPAGREGGEQEPRGLLGSATG